MCARFFRMFAHMKALILSAVGQPLTWHTDLARPKPGKGDALVAIRAAALNARDLWISKGQYAGIQLPCIPGSDGAGEWEGSPVLINPSMRWGRNTRVQGPDYEILGMPRSGTFATHVLVPRAQVYSMPAHLSMEQGAALPLAGLTAWRTLVTRCRVQAGERVLITGIGGGVALLAMQLALAMGTTVWVTSSDTDKLKRAIEMGASGGVNYRDEAWDRQLKSQSGGFDVVVDAGGGKGFALLPGLCRPGARIGIYGGTAGAIDGLSPQAIFWKQISILGSTMGTAREFGAMLRFVERQGITPVVDRVFPMQDGQKALDYMDSSARMGKVVLVP